MHADFRPGAQSYVGDRVDDLADFIEERLTGAEAVALVLAVATHHEISVTVPHDGRVYDFARRFLSPSGTVTFLFTDVERSTKLLRELGADERARRRRSARRALASSHANLLELWARD